MFAPFCPHCERRILLGPGRIVAADLARQPATVTVRCFCGNDIDAFAAMPTSDRAASIEVIAAA